jgi:hypothetical protein
MLRVENHLELPGFSSRIEEMTEGSRAALTKWICLKINFLITFVAV